MMSEYLISHYFHCSFKFCFVQNTGFVFYMLLYHIRRYFIQVRPEEVLEKALHMVQTSQKNYLYKCDQLKSIRQDLTVQRIHNELTVKVLYSPLF